MKQLNKYRKLNKRSKIHTDILGKKIDKRIRKLVVLLNLFGIKTLASCWGHKNWGYNYPWIDICNTTDNIETFKDFRLTVFSDERIRIEPREMNFKGRKQFRKLSTQLNNKRLSNKLSL